MSDSTTAALMVIAWLNESSGLVFFHIELPKAFECLDILTFAQPLKGEANPM